MIDNSKKIHLQVPREAAERLERLWRMDDSLLQLQVVSDVKELLHGHDGVLHELVRGLAVADYTPPGPIALGNTLGSFLPAGLHHEGLAKQRVGIAQFQAEKMIDAGYYVVFTGDV